LKAGISEASSHDFGTLNFLQHIFTNNKEAWFQQQP
jgi:hypothetical protein